MSNNKNNYSKDTDKNISKWHVTFTKITSGSAVISFFAILSAIIVGGILIILTNEEVQEVSVYFFSRPSDTFIVAWDSVSGAYSSLFQGSIYNFKRDNFADGIEPLFSTLEFAAPLIVAGLGVGLAFRAGMFNIGGRGQMLMAAAAAGWVGFSITSLPAFIHLPLTIIAGVVAGALWAGIAGLIKARTGAHEVILTIMLNYIAFYFIAWMLRTPGWLQAPGKNDPKTAPMQETAIFPKLLGDKYDVHWGFILSILVTILIAWLINRSSLGFKFRAVGENPNAARVAGINVNKMYVYAMLISGGLMGLAGVNQIIGTETQGFGDRIDAGVGFDAITVALLGRSKPWGIFWSGILFGAFKAGSFRMQAIEQLPIDIVLVIQSVIVLFIAAPPLVRAIFRLPSPEKAEELERKYNAQQKVEVKA